MQLNTSWLESFLDNKRFKDNYNLVGVSIMSCNFVDIWWTTWYDNLNVTINTICYIGNNNNNNNNIFLNSSMKLWITLSKYKSNKNENKREKKLHSNI